VKLHRSGHEMTTPNGYLVSSYRAAKNACLRCALRERCLKHPQSGHPRQVRVFHGRVTETLTSRMKDKIDTPKVGSFTVGGWVSSSRSLPTSAPRKE